MEEEIGANYMCFPTAYELWENINQMYSDLGNPSQIFELTLKLGELRQGEEPVTKYFNSLKRIWQDLDLFDAYEWKNVEDGQYHKKTVEDNCIFEFLAGLNVEFDEVRGRIIGRRPLPSLGEVFSEVRREESQRNVMLGKKGPTIVIEGSALTSAGPNIRRGTANLRKLEEKSGLWCNYCNKPCHTRETCWKIHGKPANFKGKLGEKNGRIFPTANEVMTTASTITKEHLEQLLALLNSNPSSSAPNVSVAHTGNEIIAFSCGFGISAPWIIDSGASDHMTNSLKLLKLYSPCPENKKVKIADGSFSPIAGKGSVQISEKIALKSVLYVPKLTCNLLSVSKLSKDSNCRVVFCDSHCTFQDRSSGKTIDSAKMVNGLYYFEDILPMNSSESSFLYLAPASSPASSPIPAHDLFVTPFKEHHHAYQLTLIPGIGIIITGVTILLLLILIILIQRKNRQLKASNSPEQSTFYASSSQHVWKNKKGTPPIFCRYSYKEIKKATGNFSTIIGQDGFGMLFKAQFDDGFSAAVKLNNNLSELSEQEFSQEIEFLGRLHHRHILTFKGICYSRQERFMVYEFMENGSLKHQLHSSSGRNQLAWKTRVQIAVDVANALEYLHFYCDTPICHGDLRPSNVLLDKNFLAKVAYFGLEHSTRNAKRFLDHNENALGASGYLDPEYMVSQKMTNKSDVYSFGVLLLELVSGKQAFDNTNLVQWFQDLADNGLTELADPAIADTVNLEQLHVVLQIANMCTQKESRERPSIKQVLRMLYEQLDPLYIGFAKAVEDEGCYGGGRLFIEKQPVNEIIAFTGDARCLQSSSSTSRSYCSRSILLECNSPQSPHGI